METSWGKVASWYDSVVKEEGSYQKEVILPHLIRLLGPKEGDVVLDVACGQGFFSVEFYKKGADVIGVDIAPELIEIAKQNIPERSHAIYGKTLDFQVSAADEMPFVKKKSIDIALCVLAMQNMPHIERVCQRIAEVLKKNGRFGMVLNHPAFRVPKSSDWQYKEKEKILAREVEKYMTDHSIKMDMNPGSDSKEYTVSYHHPISYFIKALVRCGLVVTNMEEWVSHKQSESGPRSLAENKARQEFPLFLYIEAKKV